MIDFLHSVYRGFLAMMPSRKAAALDPAVEDALCLVRHLHADV